MDGIEPYFGNEHVHHMYILFRISMIVPLIIMIVSAIVYGYLAIFDLMIGITNFESIFFQFLIMDVYVKSEAFYVNSKKRMIWSDLKKLKTEDYLSLGSAIVFAYSVITIGVILIPMNQFFSLGRDIMFVLFQVLIYHHFRVERSFEHLQYKRLMMILSAVMFIPFDIIVIIHQYYDFFPLDQIALTEFIIIIVGVLLIYFLGYDEEQFFKVKDYEKQVAKYLEKTGDGSGINSMQLKRFVSNARIALIVALVTFYLWFWFFYQSVNFLENLDRYIFPLVVTLAGGGCIVAAIFYLEKANRLVVQNLQRNMKLISQFEKANKRYLDILEEGESESE